VPTHWDIPLRASAVGDGNGCFVLESGGTVVVVGTGGGNGPGPGGTEFERTGIGSTGPCQAGRGNVP